MSEEESMPGFSADVAAAVAALKRGEVILYPTDTVWGLGCDACNAEAVAKIFQIKRRDDSRQMLVLASGYPMLERYVEEVPEIAYDLIEVADKPLTIIYDKAKGLSPNLSGSDGSIGIRITRERYSSELCKRLGRPIVSTSANISGQPAPAIFSQISPEIIEAADYVAFYRREDTSVTPPSGIIKLSNSGVFKIIR